MSRALAAVQKESVIAGFAAAGIAAHLALRLVPAVPLSAAQWPLYAVMAAGVPLVAKVTRRLLAKDFSADLLAAISIAACAAMGQPLAGSILVLMLSGGNLLEQLATRRASSVLEALARRMPRVAHRKQGLALTDLRIDEVTVGDILAVLPHEICPVDGAVIEGHGRMNEAYLTGEPFEVAKTPGSSVISGAINGESALTIRAEKKAVDSRYASIMRVVESAKTRRPRLRRLADQLAAVYTPLALAAAAAAWAFSGDPLRFLAVLVVATPCPLLIAIPVAIIAAVSLSAREGIIVKDPAILEQITECRTVIFDKTGTLTYGRPALTSTVCAAGMTEEQALRLAASLEQYSKHPLAAALLAAAPRAPEFLEPASEVSEKPGQGLAGRIAGRAIRITGRRELGPAAADLPPSEAGLECVLLIDGSYAALFRFHDEPRPGSRRFLAHLSPIHGVERVMLVSGDREKEVRHLADAVGIAYTAAGQSPEQKVSIVARESRRAKTLFVGDGINDAAALLAATVGIAIGIHSDIASEAAGAVVMTPSIGKLDTLIHIGRRMRVIALQSAVGGMALSCLGMAAAASGRLSPVEGAVLQELIDLAAILNAVRVAWPPRSLNDY